LGNREKKNYFVTLFFLNTRRRDFHVISFFGLYYYLYDTALSACSSSGEGGKEQVEIEGKGEIGGEEGILFGHCGSNNKTLYNVFSNNLISTGLLRQSFYNMS
jgi:hypothetical protein